MVLERGKEGLLLGKMIGCSKKTTRKCKFRRESPNALLERANCWGRSRGKTAHPESWGGQYTRIYCFKSTRRKNLLGVKGGGGDRSSRRQRLAQIGRRHKIAELIQREVRAGFPRGNNSGGNRGRGFCRHGKPRTNSQ